ncbi:hypothetical protein JW859_08920 [bacterium]|nr:hypothetical protein [bacterium]
MRYFFATLVAILFIAGCPAAEPDTAQPAGQPAASAAGGTGEPQAPAPVDPAQLVAEIQKAQAEVPELAPPKQLVLIYTGHTLSRVQASADFDPPEGGLSALMATIIDYEAQIVEYNRRRILNAGGNADHIQTDLENGFLGEHPFMLLDYGGWSRPHDYVGAPYVGLYLRMFTALKYTAVGCTLYNRLPPERWEAYRQRAPEGFSVLVSVGDVHPQALPRVDIVTREVHGDLWGVVAVPSPGEDTADPIAVQQAFINQAAEVLKETGCRFGILLLADGGPSVYQELAEDSRFTVVIGAASRLAAVDGYGEVTEQGPVLLPALAAGGREVGVCHLYYADGGDRPVQYYFSRKPVVDDDPELPLPFRPQVAEAVQEHEELYREYQAQH